jgi:hypothetical protein
MPLAIPAHPEQPIDLGSNRLAVLAAEIRAAHEDARSSAEHSVQRAYDAGKWLMEAKADESIPRGGWERWVENVAGVPHRTAAHYIQLFNAVANGRVTLLDIAEAGQIGVLRMLRTEEARVRREASRTAPEILDGMDLRIGDCRVVLSDIADNSIPLILTDPPYEDGAEPLWRWLGPWAHRVLIPGGSLICYFGGARLNRLYRIFDDAGLVHWWPCAMMHDQAQRLLGKNIIANHKQIVWYVKEFRRGRTLVPDVVYSAKRDKSQHAWGQGDGGITQWIHQLTEPGETIVDPCCGTGEWGLIACREGRRWTGCDIVSGGTTNVVADECGGGRMRGGWGPRRDRRVEQQKIKRQPATASDVRRRLATKGPVPACDFASCSPSLRRAMVLAAASTVGRSRWPTVARLADASPAHPTSSAQTCGR